MFWCGRCFDAIVFLVMSKVVRGTATRAPEILRPAAAAAPAPPPMSPRPQNSYAHRPLPPPQESYAHRPAAAAAPAPPPMSPRPQIFLCP